MYVCVCVCMYVCVYVCMYVCMYVCVYVCACMCVYICMYVCVCVCMYICMYVCVYGGRKTHTVPSSPWIIQVFTVLKPSSLYENYLFNPPFLLTYYFSYLFNPYLYYFADVCIKPLLSIPFMLFLGLSHTAFYFRAMYWAGITIHNMY
jgi:hypothetical protein